MRSKPHYIARENNLSIYPFQVIILCLESLWMGQQQSMKYNLFSICPNAEIVFITSET